MSSPQPGQTGGRKHLFIRGPKVSPSPRDRGGDSALTVQVGADFVRLASGESVALSAPSLEQ